MHNALMKCFRDVKRLHAMWQQCIFHEFYTL
jgi:hypothetical protein